MTSLAWTIILILACGGIIMYGLERERQDLEATTGKGCKKSQTNSRTPRGSKPGSGRSSSVRKSRRPGDQVGKRQSGGVHKPKKPRRVGKAKR